MAKTLDVYLHDELVGNLIQDDHGQMLFEYIVSTTLYPELSKQMAMKIGDEYSSDHVRPRDFEKLAEEAGLAKPIVRKRVPELAEAILAVIEVAKLEIAHPVAEAVAVLIRKRCERVQESFRN